MLDSGWLKELRQAGTPFFVIVLIALLGLAVARRVWGLSEPFQNSWAWVDALTVIFFFVVLALVCGWLLNTSKKTPMSIKKWRFRRRYCSLNSTQKAFLHGKFLLGSRHFDMPIDQEKIRWFEEMTELGLVTPITLLAWVSGMPSPYEIPVEVWDILEQRSNK